jgi:LCP family protein required for cell wall assembly
VSAVPQPETAPRAAAGMLRRFLLGALAIVALSTAAVSTGLLLEFKDSVDIFERSSTPLAGGVEQALAGVEPGRPQTIALLGSDRRYEDKVEGKPVRSDTIMLVRLDPDRGATAVMNVPRDLRVRIPGEGTMKINEAYARGGPRLTIRTLTQLLDIPIHHVVVAHFGGFRKAIDRLGCVYVDVDRRYYHSNAGLPPGQRYAEIDVPAGYQRLCGQDSLDFVRHRYTDNDFVRAARQQEYLRQAKDQIGISKLFSDRKRLLQIFGQYTETDANLRGDTQLLRVLKLAYEASKNPIREVRFPGRIEDLPFGSFVVATPAELRRTAREFMAVRGSAAPRRQREPQRPRRPARRRAGALASGLVAAREEGRARLLDLSFRLDARRASGPRLPVYYPSVRLALGGYTQDTRAYTLRNRGGRRHRAYRVVLSAGADGQFYGVQGTTWMAPPLLDNPTRTVRTGGRTLQVFGDGPKTRVIAWRTRRAVYWVSNTLTHDLSNAQMLDIARSLTRVGR